MLSGRLQRRIAQPKVQRVGVVAQVEQVAHRRGSAGDTVAERDVLQLVTDRRVQGEEVAALLLFLSASPVEYPVVAGDGFQREGQVSPSFCVQRAVKGGIVLLGAAGTVVTVGAVEDLLE